MVNLLGENFNDYKQALEIKNRIVSTFTGKTKNKKGRKNGAY